jgi:hypothetical protein
LHRVVVTAIAVSPAISFEIDAQRDASGARLDLGAGLVRQLAAASVRASMSASMRLDHLELADALAELLRSRAYCAAASSAPWAIPTACAAMPGRRPVERRSASSQPWPSSPMRFASARERRRS